MPGIYGGSLYKAYKAEMEKIVAKTRHEQLMSIDDEYRKFFELLATKGNTLEQRQMYRRRLKQIADSYEYDFKFKRIPANRDKLIISMLPMVLALAKKYLSYCRNTVYMEDLVQAGNLGCIIGVDRILNTPVDQRAKYDKIKVSSYVYPWVKKYIFEEAFGKSTGFGGTVRDKEAANKFATIVPQKQENNNDDYLNDTWDVDQRVMKSNGFKDLVIIEDEVKKFQAQSKKMFSILSTNDKNLLFMAYGIDTPNGIIYTQAECAKHFGTTVNVIRKRMENIMWKLKRATKDTVSGHDMINAYCLIQGLDLRDINVDDAWKISAAAKSTMAV